MTDLPDTNIVVGLLRYRPAQVCERFRPTVSEGTSPLVSSIVLFELWYGVARSERREKNAERLRVFLAGDLGVLPRHPNARASTAGAW